jgi:hypothetical protein
MVGLVMFGAVAVVAGLLATFFVALLVESARDP